MAGHFAHLLLDACRAGLATPRHEVLRHLLNASAHVAGPDGFAYGRDPHHAALAPLDQGHGLVLGTCLDEPDAFTFHAAAGGVLQVAYANGGPDRGSVAGPDLPTRGFSCPGTGGTVTLPKPGTCRLGVSGLSPAPTRSASGLDGSAPSLLPA